MTLRICKLQISHYSQIFTINLLIKCKNSEIYGKMVVITKKKVLWNRPHCAAFLQKFWSRFSFCVWGEKRKLLISNRKKRTLQRFLFFTFEFILLDSVDDDDFKGATTPQGVVSCFKTTNNLTPFCGQSYLCVCYDPRRQSWINISEYTIYSVGSGVAQLVEWLLPDSRDLRFESRHWKINVFSLL